MVNRLIIAAAGSGKTTYLVRQAMQQSDSVLITTYTIANELEIRKKIVELNGFVPHNVTIQTWYSFLLQHGVRPFQGVVLDDKINGMILVNEKSGKKYDGKYGPVYFAEDDYRKYYNGMRRYIDYMTTRANDGERICQMVIAAHSHVDWEPVETLDDTERGAGGFGHTGKE